MTLNEINNAARLMLNSIEEAGGDMDGLETAYDDLFLSVTDKLQAYACVIERLQSEETALAERIKEFQARKKAVETNVERLKDNMLNTMQLLDLSKCSDVYTITRQKSPVSVDVANLEKLPEKFQTIKTTISANKSEIKQALERGESVEGCKLVNDNFYIKIK